MVSKNNTLAKPGFGFRKSSWQVSRGSFQVLKTEWVSCEVLSAEEKQEHLRGGGLSVEKWDAGLGGRGAHWVIDRDREEEGCRM